MNIHEERAREFFLQGYTCAQSVILAYADEIGLDTDTAIRLGASFGGGIGRMREVCGGITGACIVLGMLHGDYAPTDLDAKAKHYADIQAFAEAFRRENGSILCRDLLHLDENAPIVAKPDARTEEYYRSRPCTNIVGTAARLLEKWIY